VVNVPHGQRIDAISTDWLIDIPTKIPTPLGLFLRIDVGEVDV
jgi:hypothetical protein